ncbi:hypothetical protein E2C01_020258 [Portunus trituberculatus]|uniref:Uncharacterized protein n=1 Tax=Portunus trituberculatus TaxID=210409 RepID=A0A5B7E118_PORTR|nr:hypothetical protein [Portunus trituberculatus]
MWLWTRLRSLFLLCRARPSLYRSKSVMLERWKTQEGPTINYKRPTDPYKAAQGKLMTNKILQTAAAHLVAVNDVHNDGQLAPIRPLIEVNHPADLDQLTECLRQERAAVRHVL